MLWSKIKRVVDEREEKNLMKIVNRGTEMKMSLMSISNMREGAMTFDNLRNLIRKIDRDRTIIYATLVEISEGDKDLLADLRKILYQTEQAKEDLFSPSDRIERSALIRYQTANSSFLTSIKQSVEDYLKRETPYTFKELIKTRVGFWVTPVSMIKRKGGGTLNKAETEELEEIEDKLVPTKKEKIKEELRGETEGEEESKEKEKEGEEEMKVIEPVEEE